MPEIAWSRSLSYHAASCEKDGATPRFGRRSKKYFCIVSHDYYVTSRRSCNIRICCYRRRSWLFRGFRGCFMASRHTDGAVRGLVYERPPIEPKEAANHVEASFEVGRNGAWGCPRGWRGRRHGKRLGHYPGRTGVEPVYRRRGGLGRWGRRDRIGSGRLSARRNTRWRRNRVGQRKSRPRLPPPPPSRNQKSRSSVRNSRRRKRPPAPTPTLAQTPPAQQAPLAVAPAAPPAPSATEPEREAEAPAADEPSVAEPREVDRYESGDITYVMFSDGAVEVRTLNGAQRFASLAELRAQAAQQY